MRVSSGEDASTPYVRLPWERTRLFPVECPSLCGPVVDRVTPTSRSLSGNPWQGEHAPTRTGLTAQAAACGVLRAQRGAVRLSTSRLSLAEHRGSSHGTYAYPFSIGKAGVSVRPSASLGPEHGALTPRVSTGASGLDTRLENDECLPLGMPERFLQDRFPLAGTGQLRIRAEDCSSGNCDPDLIADTRAAIQETGKPYVIENVEDARGLLLTPIKLCGSALGLPIWRHRYFVVPSLSILTPPCRHDFEPVLITGTNRYVGRKRREPSVSERKQAAGIDWMTDSELGGSILPAYTEFISWQLLKVVRP